MKYVLIAILSLTLISCQRGGGSLRAMNAHAGSAYLQSQQCALMASIDMCPCPDCPWEPADDEQSCLVASLDACDWPDNYPGIDEPGSAYREGQAAADDADCHEDKEEQKALEEEQAESEEDHET